MRWAVGKRQTVGLAEKCNSKEQRYFPTITTSALLHQCWADSLGWWPTRDRELVLFGGPIRIERLPNVDLFDILVLLRPREMTAFDSNLYANMRCRRNISIYAQGLVRYVVKRWRTYGRWTGAQVRLSFLCNSIGSLPINNTSLYFKSGISCTIISYWCPKWVIWT